MLSLTWEVWENARPGGPPPSTSSIGLSDAAATPTNKATPAGERRQVTALFADMVGFTAVSERLGEEKTFALIHPIYELMAKAVRAEGGSVKDFTGDGIMALFGVPDALPTTTRRWSILYPLWRLLAAVHALH